MLGVSLLSLTVWWTRKPGAATFMGLIATLLNFILRPDAIHFLGFTAASIVFDAATSIIGYGNSLERGLFSLFSLVSVSFVSTGIAGVIIGSFFMTLRFFPTCLEGSHSSQDCTACEA